MSIIVFGSINIDLVATTSRLPIAGETILGEDFFKIPGGKGANQAVALARLEIPTYMVGRVGAQSFGAELVHNLQVPGIPIYRANLVSTQHSALCCMCQI